MDFFAQGFPVLTGMIQAPPGAIIGPIATFFGYIVDILYRGASAITPINALGISIIVLTLIVRGAMVPQQFKMQRNSRKVQLAKPEMDKLKEKYGGNPKDPELRRKMMAEQQAINQKYGINMWASCIPLIVTMPIFIALFAVFGRAFLFIPSITEVYSSLSQALIDTPFHTNVLAGIVEQYRPANMLISTNNVYDLNRALHVLTQNDWNVIFGVLEGQSISDIYSNYGYTLRGFIDGAWTPLTQEMLEATVANIPADRLEIIRYYYDAKMSVQSFLGLDMITPSGWAFPGIIIPVLAVLTMAYSSFQLSKINPATDDQGKMMQRISMFVLPLMFGWFTVGAASAVGIYWVAGNIFMIVQNFVIFKFFAHKLNPVMDDKGKKKKDERR
ncbi:MAG: YidC/Oxa1 family membrane protein insertase [Defluviitaleaceae bacterium]|nr:YidC/Oxa1 family membrane protein insertase [Defluviitaleaceae bacterium]